MTMLGVYAGSNMMNVTSFEAWLGRRVDFASVHTGEASWADFQHGVAFEIAQFRALDRPVIWSVPLLPKGADLRQAAAGTYNAHYGRAAAEIASARREDPLYVRTGWEQNGSWMTWAAKGREAEFIEAFRQFAGCFRKASSRMRLVWCPNIGQNDPALTYAGDEWVDVIGMDVYHNPEWDPLEPDAAWRYMVTRQFGLQWHLAFARQHRKPMAYPEWGVSSKGFAGYIANMARWFEASDVLYQAYWNSDAAYAGELSRGDKPEDAAAFRTAFGRPDRR